MKKRWDAGTSDAVSAFTASTNFRINPRIEYEEEGTSTGTKEQHKTLEQKITNEDPSEVYETQDPGRQSGGTLQRFFSAWAGVLPTSKATYEGCDGLLWWRDLAHCQNGDLSLSAVQANSELEDYCCVESSLPLGTVIGVFDGHGGPAAARFVCDHLLPNLRGEILDATRFTLDA